MTVPRSQRGPLPTATGGRCGRAGSVERKGNVFLVCTVAQAPACRTALARRGARVCCTPASHTGRCWPNSLTRCSPILAITLFAKECSRIILLMISPSLLAGVMTRLEVYNFLISNPIAFLNVYSKYTLIETSSASAVYTIH